MQVHTRKGDGENDTFVTSFAVARVPEVKVARDNDYTGDRPTQEEWDAIEPDTVGVRGLQEDKDWYWQSGSHEINQDRDGTVLESADFIRIEYRGEYPLVIKTRSPSQIEFRKEEEEHGTGIVENVKQEPAVRTREGTFQLANELINKYGTIGRTIRFTTMENGLKPGQLLEVNLPEYGLTDLQVLIERINLREEAGHIFYDVECVEGPEKRSWQNFFEQIVTRGEDVIREGIGEDEIIIIPFEFEKTWTEEEEPNIFYELYPDNGETPGGIYPSFDPDQRVRYLEWWIDGSAAGRKLITDSTGMGELSVNEIFTLTYLDPGDALGSVTGFAWIGGIDATLTLGTGIEVDKQNETITADPGVSPWEKTGIESWQIEKTEKKWSV